MNFDTLHFIQQTDQDLYLHLEKPSIGRTHRYLYGTSSYRKLDEEGAGSEFGQKEDPRTKTKEYRELEKVLDKMEEEQKINYLKKRLTSHICSIYIETHPELGLVADEDPRMVNEIQRRVFRIHKILDDSPLYSPFLRGINTDLYNETGWSRRQKLAAPLINDIKTLIRKVENKPVEKEPKMSEMNLSDLIYENENKKKSTLLPEVFILRGLYSLLKIQKIESLRYASEKDISMLRANHGNYRNALRYIAKGLFNGGFTLFNAIIFGSFFDKYIQNYRTWLGIEMVAIKFSGRLDVDQLRSKVKRHVATLKDIRKNNKNIPILTRMYPWFSDDYKYVRIKKSDIKAAIGNYENKNHGKKVHGIVNRQMLALYMNLTTFLAGSPLSRLAVILSKELKTSDLELTLQKRMIQSTQMLNNYYRMLGLGVDSQKGQGNSFKLLQGLLSQCSQTIEGYVLKKGGQIDKSYERDPFMKTYIAINAFLQAYPDDKAVRKLLHEFQPNAEKLLRASASSNQIKIANTIVHNIKTSKRRNSEP